MSKNRFLHFSVATAVALLLASPALAKCALPSGQFIGGGAGPTFGKAGVSLGGQVESWNLVFPANNVDGKVTLAVRTPPQPGVPASYFGAYSATDINIQKINTTSSFATTWNPDACTGSMWVSNFPAVTWYSENNVTKTQTYTRPSLKYNFTVTNNGATVLLTVDPASFATSIPGPSTNANFPAFVPAYTIQLDRQ